MITYNINRQEPIAETLNQLMVVNGSVDLYALDIQWTEDGTSECSNQGGETLFFADKDSAMAAYQAVLATADVEDYSFMDVSVACYNIQKDDIDFPMSDEDIAENYAMNMDSDNDIISQRISGSKL